MAPVKAIEWHTVDEERNRPIALLDIGGASGWDLYKRRCVWKVVAFIECLLVCEKVRLRCLSVVDRNRRCSSHRLGCLRPVMPDRRKGEHSARQRQQTE